MIVWGWFTKRPHATRGRFVDFWEANGKPLEATVELSIKRHWELDTGKPLEATVELSIKREDGKWLTLLLSSKEFHEFYRAVSRAEGLRRSHEED